MLNAFLNCLKIPELRARIFTTFGFIFIARIGAAIPLPGVNPEPLQRFYESQSSNAILGLFNMFTGGALFNGAVFALGIMPYISASIILQLMTAVVPTLARLQQEGEIGRQKITQYTRYLTIGIALVQGLLMTLALSNYPEKIFPGYDMATWGPIVIMQNQFWFILTSTLFLTGGTILLMWIGEQITQKGVGNGISLLITIGIIADFPNAIMAAYSLVTAPEGAETTMSIPVAMLMVFLFIAVVAGIVAVTQAVRKIPVQYAKRVVGRKVMGGQSSFLPLKVNYSGVMPVIFASAILLFPGQILEMLYGATDIEFFRSAAQVFNPQKVWYFLIYTLLILGFSYFWVSIMFKPIQIADELKKNGGYIPGVRPGEPTAKFLDFVMTRLTLAGSIFLAAIALFPNLIMMTQDIPQSIALFFGGTGTLIAVGVMIDSMRQIETYLLQRHYDGFLKKGRSRSRASARTKQLVDTSELKNLGALWTPLTIIFIVGLVSWVLREFVL